MKTILVHLAEGFEEIEAITPVDVLRRAGFDVKTVSVTGKKQVNGAHQVQFVADLLFEETDYSRADMILLPGGMPGSSNLNSHNGLKAMILEYQKQGKDLAAICAAPMVLGRLGVLKGKKATCYPGFEKELEGAAITGKQAEVDGKVITGRGPGAAMDFALAIVEYYLGKGKALAIANQMMVA